MNTKARLIKKHLTHTEGEVISFLKEKLKQEDTMFIVMSDFAQECGATRSTINSTLRILCITSVVSTRSLGCKGTLVKVLDRETLEHL